MADRSGNGAGETNNNNARNNNNRTNNQTSLLIVRDRFFHAMYFKAALAYARIFPKPMRRALELFILLKALLFFGVLLYLHFKVLKTPSTCLDFLEEDLLKDGVLRVEILPNEYDRIFTTTSQASLFSDLQFGELRSHWQSKFNGIGPKTEQFYGLKSHTEDNFKSHSLVKDAYVQQLYLNESMFFNYERYEQKPAEVLESGEKPVYYIVEYALEYGFLRISHATRQRLKIPVHVVRLNPNSNTCFGDALSRFLLKEFVGYDDLLMSSVRIIAEKHDHKGYLRNVITGEHYRFVPMWWAAWSSYPTALCVMILFTICISMLLRYSHHQIFVFIVDLLQMLEFNSTARFPFASLLTVILALVGMEAIMSEFFNDTTTAFYIILIVWIADQYDAICCHTTITKRHWLRFFYLYHFVFYAYHYRFSGHYSNLALVSSWLFIQHSMFYFFHHFELPVIIQQSQILNIQNQRNRTQMNNNNNNNNNNTGRISVRVGIGEINQLLLHNQRRYMGMLPNFRRFSVRSILQMTANRNVIQQTQQQTPNVEQNADIQINHSSPSTLSENTVPTEVVNETVQTMDSVNRPQNHTTNDSLDPDIGSTAEAPPDSPQTDLKVADSIEGTSQPTVSEMGVGDSIGSNNINNDSSKKQK